MAETGSGSATPEAVTAPSTPPTLPDASTSPSAATANALAPTPTPVTPATPNTNNVAAARSGSGSGSGSTSLQPAQTPIRAGTPLEHQVAGHGGVMEDESGDLVIKPALPREIAFYQLVASAPRSSPLALLQPFLAKFYGTLQLQGRAAEDGSVVPLAGPGSGDESVVLENLVSQYTHPCVMDIKIGTTLHGPDATPEKAARMEKKARESTIGSKGMRVTGSKTWHAPSQSWIDTPRSFGYALTPERLPENMVRFFPLPTDELPFMTDDEGKKGPEVFAEHAMPARLTYRVLSLLDEQLARLESALSSLELRLVGASLLLVYEGDPLRLASALERYDARRVSDAAKSLAGRNVHRHALGDEVDPDSDEDEDEDDEDDYDDSEDDSDLELDGPKADARRAARAPPFSLRLIDFAHTWLVQGEGPDKGVLFGLETVRGLVKGRMAEVKEWMDRHEPESPSKVSAGFGPQAEVQAGAEKAQA